MLIIEEYKAENELAFNEYLTDVKSTEELHQRDMYIIDSAKWHEKEGVLIWSYWGYFKARNYSR